MWFYANQLYEQATLNWLSLQRTEKRHRLSKYLISLLDIRVCTCLTQILTHLPVFRNISKYLKCKFSSYYYHFKSISRDSKDKPVWCIRRDIASKLEQYSQSLLSLLWNRFSVGYIMWLNIMYHNSQMRPMQLYKLSQTLTINENWLHLTTGFYSQI